MFSDFKTSSRPVMGQNHQILDLLVVDFDNWKADLERFRGVLKLLNTIKDFITSYRDYTLIGSVPNLDR